MTTEQEPQQAEPTTTLGYIITRSIWFLLGMVPIPFALIWSINTLFSTKIAYTFENWAATSVIIVFIMVLNGNTRPSK